MSERPLFRMIWRLFIESLKPKSNVRLFGVDENGTKFYESVGGARKKRYYEPVVKRDESVQIANEWDSWLRFRRETAPTNEEIARRILMDKIRIENAIKLEKQQQSLKKVDPKLLPKNTNGFTSFPDYKDEYRK